MSTETEPTPSPQPTDPPSLVSQPTTPETPAPAPETPPAEPAPAVEPLAPLSFENIKLPEGLTIPDEDRTAVLDIMNDDKLSGADRLQRLVDFQGQVMQRAAEANFKAWTDLQSQWQDAVRADPEIGGDKLQPALGEISKLVDKYGSPELREAMDTTGAGNHPAIVKFLSKVAKDLSEGGPVLGAPSSAKESLADRMYPSMKKQGA